MTHVSLPLPRLAPDDWRGFAYHVLFVKKNAAGLYQVEFVWSPFCNKAGREVKGLASNKSAAIQIVKDIAKKFTGYDVTREDSAHLFVILEDCGTTSGIYHISVGYDKLRKANPKYWNLSALQYHAEKLEQEGKWK